MRPLFLGAAFLALGLTACFPNLEGAGCTSDLNCPREQACVEEVCVTRCTKSCSGGLVCGVRSGEEACECPANYAGNIWADPGNPEAGTGPLPTGVREPAACRTPTIGAALKLGEQQVAADSTGATRVRVLVVDSPEPKLFSNESWPLEVKAGITLTSPDDPLLPERYVFQQPFNGGSSVNVYSGGSFAGFTVSGQGPATPLSPVVRVRCDGPGNVELNALKIEGDANDEVLVPSGIRVEGACPVLVRSVEVKGTDLGLVVANSGEGLVTVKTSLFENNRDGIRVESGALEVEDVNFLSNVISGIHVLTLLPANSPAHVKVKEGTFSGVENTGIWIEKPEVAPPNLAVEVEAEASQFTSGLAGWAQQWGTGKLSTSSLSGMNAGVVVSGGSLTLDNVQLERNGGGAFAAGAGSNLTLRNVTSRRNTENGATLDDGARGLFESSHLDENGGVGLLLANASEATVNGSSSVSNNGGVGLRSMQSSLTVTGVEGSKVSIDNNGKGGIVAVGGLLTANHVSLKGNTGIGVSVADTESRDAGTHYLLQDCEVSAKEGTGTLLHAPAVASRGGSSLVVNRCQFEGGTVGVELGKGSNAVSADILNSTIQGASSVGLVVNSGPTSLFQITGNEIFNNRKGLNPLGIPGTGGVVFVGNSAPFSRAGNFRGNRIHSNGGSQVGVTRDLDDSGTWALGTGSCAKGLFNAIYCYDSREVGLKTDARVNMGNTSWANTSPKEGQDFVSPVTAALNAEPACALSKCP